MTTRLRAVGAAIILLLFAALPCQAQTPVPAGASAKAEDQPPAAPAAPAATPEIELNITNLPTTRSLKRHQGYFRLTHRFAADLRRGSFGQLAENLFTIDQGAIIGLEYRFGITSNLQAGVHRSMLSKTIQFFGKYDGWRQGDRLPVSISLIASIEGLNNLQDNHQPAIVASISRVVGSRLMLYATPGFVANTRAADFLTGHDHGLPGEEVDEHGNHEHTAFLGFGGRARVRPTFYVTGEFTPRLAGHDPGRGAWGVSLEKMTRGGGHTLQLNFTNSFGTTFGQLARGGSEHDIYLGFNITRKF
ncbi:MAG: DUF5777 family beta-barrel protein [Vicinamibacterales bacterium]